MLITKVIFIFIKRGEKLLFQLSYFAIFLELMTFLKKFATILMLLREFGGIFMNKDKYKVELSTEVSSIVKKAIYKKYVIIGIILVTLLAMTLIIVTRNNNYNKALEKLEAEEYERAYEILNNLGGTKRLTKLKKANILDQKNI